MTSSTFASPGVPAAADPTTRPITITRRTIDHVLIGLGAVLTAVLATAGGLLVWGSSFADDYVSDELSSQNIYFPAADSLREEGRSDLLGYAGEQVTSGGDAEAYASYIDGHLAGIADGMTYADLGPVERAANAAVDDAVASGAGDDEVAALQADADEVTSQRNSLFKGETLRGLLLSTYAWSTIGQIAFIAAVVAVVAAAVMAALVAGGFVHLRRRHHAH